jgi:cytoskeleton protein RodZ
VSEQSLGERLKELREQQQLTREQLYNRTKILVRYIEALEEGRWDLLPGQAYLKPFVKNIAEALGADYEKLAHYIDKAGAKVQPPAPPPKTGGFDFRWLIVAVLIILIALIVFILKPMDNDETQVKPEQQAAPVVAETETENTLLERNYSSAMDMAPELFDSTRLQKIELEATDSVWILLTTEEDTVYNGVLAAGRKITRESLKPFELLMGRSNCLRINYNGIELDPEGVLLNRRRLKFADLDFSKMVKPEGTE